MTDPLLEIKNLKVYFPIKAGLISHTIGHIKAVDGVDLTFKRGETIGLVGESGCGKTTIGRSIVRLNEPVQGEIIFKGRDVLKLKGKELREIRRHLQIVFQDPYSSLNPRQTVRRLIGEILMVQFGLSSREANERTSELLQQVGLSPVFAERYPHEFSGGQRQRVAIAKAIALKPDFLVCDEAVSALDVSIQSQIINLLMDLKEKYDGLTYLFISHALNVIEHISDKVAVMYLGKIVEYAQTDELFDRPAHPYTKALLSAVPVMAGAEHRDKIILTGETPGADQIPSGCRFHPRCPYAFDRCSVEEPQLKSYAAGHQAACFLLDQ